MAEVAHHARQLGPGIADRLHAGLHHAFLQFGRDVVEALQRAANSLSFCFAHDLQELVAGQHQLADHGHQVLEQLDIDADGLVGDRFPSPPSFFAAAALAASRPARRRPLARLGGRQRRRQPPPVASSRVAKIMPMTLADKAGGDFELVQRRLQWPQAASNCASFMLRSISTDLALESGPPQSFAR